MHQQTKVLTIVDNHDPKQNEFFELYLDEPQYTIELCYPSQYTNAPDTIETVYADSLDGYVVGETVLIIK